MARNIEIKARARNFQHQLEIGQGITTKPLTILKQKDTFFIVEKGRLKLREFPDQDAQLIFYHRSDQAGPKLSDYHITRTPDADQLKETLTLTMGKLGEVTKERTLLMCGRTRMHFDRVANLCEFIELEVVLQDNENIEQGEQEASELMRTLKIDASDLIECAYLDLLKEKP